MLAIRSTLASLCVLSLAACGGSAPPSKVANGAAASAADAPYAALFVDGQTRVYHYTHDADGGDEDTRLHEESDVTCHVTARALGAWQVAQMACADADGQPAQDYLTAIYLADARGLWRASADQLPTDDASAAALVVDDDPVLVADPTPVDEHQVVDEGTTMWQRVTQPSPGTWCRTWGEFGEGDGGSDEVCAQAGRGLTKVANSRDGGTAVDDVYQLTP